jgi:hypothetical protein
MKGGTMEEREVKQYEKYNKNIRKKETRKSNNCAKRKYASADIPLGSRFVSL